MAREKEFKIHKDDIKQLIAGVGTGLATDKNTVLGEPINCVYREESSNNIFVSWQLLFLLF